MFKQNTNKLTIFEINIAFSNMTKKVEIKKKNVNLITKPSKIFQVFEKNLCPKFKIKRKVP